MACDCFSVCTAAAPDDCFAVESVVACVGCAEEAAADYSLGVAGLVAASVVSSVLELAVSMLPLPNPVLSDSESNHSV